MDDPQCASAVVSKLRAAVRIPYNKDKVSTYEGWNLVPQRYYFCIKNALKLNYDHHYFKKYFLGSLSLAINGKDNKGKKGKGGERRGRREGREGKGREGKGREGKGREGEGREGKVSETSRATAPKFGTLSSPLARI
jgi:hypothetical protein